MEKSCVVLVILLCTVADANGKRKTNGNGLSGCGSELFKPIIFREPYIGREPRVYSNDTTVIICLFYGQGPRHCLATT